MSRNMVRMKVSGEFIRQALSIPDGATIYNIGLHEICPDVFWFLVEHPDLPEVLEGQLPIEVSPLITADYEKRPDTWLTFDWGLEVEGEANGQIERK